jgi:MFS family permease
LGIAEALIMPAYSSMYSRNLTKGKFASQWGYWDSLIYITIGVSGITGGYIAQELGFRTLFVIMTIAAVLSLISTLLLIKKFDIIFKRRKIDKNCRLR